MTEKKHAPWNIVNERLRQFWNIVLSVIEGKNIGTGNDRRELVGILSLTRRNNVGILFVAVSCNIVNERKGKQCWNIGKYRMGHIEILSMIEGNIVGMLLMTHMGKCWNVVNDKIEQCRNIVKDRMERRWEIANNSRTKKR